MINRGRITSDPDKEPVVKETQWKELTEEELRELVLEASNSVAYPYRWMTEWQKLDYRMGLGVIIK